MCRVLEVSVSSYYAWIQRPASKRTQENLELIRHIREVYTNSHQTYGSPRIAAALSHQRIDALDVAAANTDVSRFVKDVEALKIWSRDYFHELARRMQLTAG
jgi:hypothetical protein